MLGLRYDSAEARAMARASSRGAMRDAAYRAASALARGEGRVPAVRRRAATSPRGIRLAPARGASATRSATHGMRNSHLLSIAPDRHHQPRLRRQRLERHRAGLFLDLHAQEARGRRHDARVRGRGPRLAAVAARAAATTTTLPPAFVTALEIAARDHMAMLAAVEPFIDTAISKTVNVPEDYPYEEFKDLYLEAWKAGLKGIATYRPNSVLGAVLSRREATRRRTSTSPSPTGASASPTRRRWRWRPALAGPAEAGRRHPVLDLHGRGAAATASRSSSATSRTAARSRSRSGSTASRRRAAWRRSPRPCRWTCARRTGPG